jgi:hypothetical protein
MPILSHQLVGNDQPRHLEYTCFPITPNDSADVPAVPGLVCVGVYAGGAGNIAAVSLGGVSISFASVPAGTILDATLKRVNATGTTATTLQALYRPRER